MSRIISAVFDHISDAESAVGALRRAGVADSAISVLRPAIDGAETVEDVQARDSLFHSGDAAREVGIGAGAGAAVGALFGLAAALVPGAGPFIAAGALTSLFGASGGAIAAGAIVGASSGAVAGSLGRWGVDETEAGYFASEIEHGATYVGVDQHHTDLPEERIREVLAAAGGRLHSAGAAHARETDPHRETIGLAATMPGGSSATMVGMTEPGRDLEPLPHHEGEEEDLEVSRRTAP